MNFRFVSAHTWQNWSYLEYADQHEIMNRLSQAEATCVRFHLYKNLFALQVQSYQEKERDTTALALALQIATTDASKRQACIDKFSEEEREIFTSYETMISLASELTVNALSKNSSFHFLIPFDVQANRDEPFQLYFLQILELEEALNFQVHSPELWIQQQTADLTDLLLSLDKEITAMQLRKVINSTNDLTLDHKEYKFYWSICMDLCNELLERLDNQ